MISLRQGLITGGSYTQINLHGNNTWFRHLEENVAPNAFHNSHARFDPPKCHPNTRVAVVQEIMNWVLQQDPEMQQIFIMWLHGAAGAGKSAIAQTIAEICYSQCLLIASFFFGRSDGSRNHARSLVATIAYQMALVLPQVKDMIIGAIEQDPLIFTRSLSTQFLSLVVNPIQHLSASGFFNNPSSPRLIIIDGLDECLDHFSQRQILDIILRGTEDHHLPLIFLVASRPEHDISARFNSTDMRDILNQLLLDDSYMPERDIELFLRDNFQDICENHPFKHLIPSHWPTDDVIKQLIEKSSGQFIYASTVIKYVNSSRHRPHHRLEVILDIRPAHGDRPFAELDALYTHIFSAITDVDRVLLVLWLVIFGFGICIEDMEKILCLESDDIPVLFCDLYSVISIIWMPADLDEGYSEYHYFKILHASLPDFLLDKARSGPFHLDRVIQLTDIVRQSIQYLTNRRLTNQDHSLRTSCGSAMELFYLYCFEALPSFDLLDAIRSFSILRVYDNALTQCQSLHDSTSPGTESSLCDFNLFFLPKIFTYLEQSAFDNLYYDYLQSFDSVLKKHLDVYYDDMHLTLCIALVEFAIDHPEHHSGVLELDHHLPQQELKRLEDVDRERLTLLKGVRSQANFFDAHMYFALLYGFLNDPSRAGQYALNGLRYSIAAGCCLRYIYLGVWDNDLAVQCLGYLLNKAEAVDELRELCISLIFEPLPANFMRREWVRRLTWDYLSRPAQ